MHPNIILIANQIGAKFAERCSFQTYMYDGQTIATYYTSSRIYYPKYHKPVYFNNYILLHELGHYLAADKNQRRYPEFGLDLAARSQFGGELSGSLIKNRCGFIDPKEGMRQEIVSTFLTFHWAKIFGIEICEERELKEKDMWEMLEFHIKYFENEMWQALIRFRKLVERGY